MAVYFWRLFKFVLNQKSLHQQLKMNPSQTTAPTRQVSLSSHLAELLNGKQDVDSEKEESEAKKWYSTALGLHNRGQLDSAIVNYLRVLNNKLVLESVVDEFVDPSNIKTNTGLYLKYLSLKNLGTIYLCKKSYHEAFVCFSKALSIDGSDVSTWFDYAIACFNKEDYATARLALEHTLSLNPHHHPAAIMLMEIVYIIGDVEECVNISKDILKNDSQNQIAKFINSECNPDPFRLLFFQQSNNKIGTNPSINELTQKRLGYLGDLSSTRNNTEMKVKIHIRELDWTAVCMRLFNIYQETDCQVMLILDTYLSDEETQMEDQMVDEEEEQTSLLGKRPRLPMTRLALPSKKKKEKSTKGKLSQEILKDFTKMDEKGIISEPEDEDPQTVEEDLHCDTLKNQDLLILLKSMNMKTFGLLELMKIFSEILCHDFWNLKWPDRLVDIVSHMISILRKRNIDVSFSCILFMSEYTFDKYEGLKLEAYLAYSRRIINKLSGLILTERLSIEPSPEEVIRFFYLRGCIDQRSTNSASAKKYLQDCLAMLSTSNNITLPNFSHHQKIRSELVEYKLTEMSYNTTVEIISKLVTQNQHEQALDYITPDLLKGLPQGQKPTIRERLYNILKNIQSLELIEPKKLVSIIAFIFSDITEDDAEQLLPKLTKNIIPKICRDTKKYSDLFVFPESEIIAFKILLLIDSGNFRKDMEETLFKTFCELLEIFYRFATFKEEGKKAYLTFCKNTVVRKFHAPIRVSKYFTRNLHLRFLESFFIFLLQELYKLYREAKEHAKTKELFKEFSSVISLLYGTKLTETSEITKNNFKDKPESVETSKEVAYLIFKVLSLSNEVRLNSNLMARKQMIKTLTLCFNTFKDLPPACAEIKPQLFSIIDQAENFLKDQITLPTPIEDPTLEYSGKFSLIRYM